MEKKEKLTVYEPNFSLRVVTHRDKKTGKIVKTNPYRVFVDNGVEYIEWPVGSGNLWFRGDDINGIKPSHAGRYENGKVLKGAAHKPYERPLTEDEKLARELATQKQELEALRAELSAIKKEKELKKFKKQYEDKKGVSKDESRA